MEPIKTTARKWGNSFGFVIPKNIADEKRIKEGTEISITIEPLESMTIGDIIKLGKKHPVPRKSKDLQKELDEIDKELWPNDESLFS